MIKGLRKNDTLYIAIIMCLVLMLIIAFSFVNIEKSELSAKAEGPEFSFILIEGATHVNNSDWMNNPDFNPVLEVTVSIEGENESETIEMDSYTVTIENERNSSYTYTGQVSAGSIDWNDNLTVAGEYLVTVTANYEGNDYSDTVGDGLNLYANVAIGNNDTNNNLEPLEFVYNGQDFYNAFDTWTGSNEDSYYLDQFFEIDHADGLPGSLSDYYLELNWGSTVGSDIIGAGDYDLNLSLGKIGDNDIYRFIDFMNNSNEGQLIINKRPLFLDTDVTIDGTEIDGKVFPENEKLYDENAKADGYLHYDEVDNEENYDYLMDYTKFGEEKEEGEDQEDVDYFRDETGFIQSEFDDIKDSLSSSPLLIFQEIFDYSYTEGSGEDEEYFEVYIDSQYVDENGDPDSSISPYDSDGEIVYDKDIILHFALNPSYSVLSNYMIARYIIEVEENEEGEEEIVSEGYEEFDKYATITFEEAGAILPGEAYVSANSAEEEYGVTSDDLNFEMVGEDTVLEEDEIGVTASGNLLGKSIGFDDNSSSDYIQLVMKVGRLYVPGVDSESDIDFMGYDANEQEMYLVEYTRFTHAVNHYYFYAEIYYQGERVTNSDPSEGYYCGSLMLNYVTSVFEVAPKQLTVPDINSLYQMEKDYDGRLEANPASEETVNKVFYDENNPQDCQWVIDEFFDGEDTVQINDAEYIQARIRPVFDNPNAGDNKTITITFVLELTEQGISENKHHLLDWYLPPDEVTITDGVINKKTVNYAFDMANSVDRPTDHPILFPDEKILIFEKPFEDTVPTIKDMVFGNYVLDENDEIQTEIVYDQRPVMDGDDYVTDFYGNIVYESYGDPIERPVRTDYFIRDEDPHSSDTSPSGFRWGDAINWDYYCIEELYPEGHENEGEQKTIQISHYDPETDMVTIIDENTSGSVLRTVNQLTPPTSYPGIEIDLNEFDTDNYVLVPKAQDNSAFLNITKKTPDWDLTSTQSHTYNGKQHSSMLDDISLDEPVREDFDSDEEYQTALEEDNMKHDTFYEIIEVNLTLHDEFMEIIGQDGKGINFDVTEYAPPNQEERQDISEYSYSDEISLIKIAGSYKIEVSLPETTNYSASEVKDLYLTIEQAEISVYLSPTEKYYGEENPSYTPLEEKTDTTESSTWGWKFYNDDYPGYMSTLLYKGFIGDEGPENIVFGNFEHSYIGYGDVDTSSQPGKYSISAKGGYAHNYSFNHKQSEIDIIPLKAEIILHDNIDEYSTTYDPDTEAWRVYEYEDGSDPLEAYTYTANDNSEVDVLVVGYKPIEAEYDFSIHYSYLKDEEGEYILDEQDNKIAIDFHPKVGLNESDKWVPYEEDESYSDVKDCTPPEGYHNAKRVGEYIMKLSANAIYFENPDPKFISFTVDYDETEVEIPEDTIVHDYDGSYFRINGKASEEEDDNFIINNQEVGVFFKVEMSEDAFDDNPSYETILEKTSYSDNIDTRIIDAGYYRVTFILEYDEEDIVNYTIPDPNEFEMYIEVQKGKVKIEFSNEEGAEDWYYKGTPYELLDPDTMESGDLGVSYSVTPDVPFEDILLEIYKYELDDGIPIEEYEDESGKPREYENSYGDDFINLPPERLVTEAVDIGIYLFRIKASGANTQNYDDSEWIEQKYEIQKKTVSVGIRGKQIPPEEQDLYPDLDRYPLQKVYGEPNPEDNLTIFYSGWVNNEDPFSDDPDKIPSGFKEAIFDWNGIDEETNARPESAYSIKTEKAKSDNYTFIYQNISFYILKKDAEILVNDDYTTSVYTGTEQQRLEHFKAKEPPEFYEEGIDRAFALNYDPADTSFTIELVGRKVFDGSGGYEIDETVTECIDVGVYVFSIAASESTNYKRINPENYDYTVEKAELKAIIEDREIIYGESYPAFELSYQNYVGKDIPENESPEYLLHEDGSCELINGTETIDNLINPELDIPSNAIDTSEGYTIRLEGGSAKNYWINVEDTANLRINKKDITVESADRIIKEYDGTREANKFITPRHYKFDGVIHHYLKESEDTVGLSFSASFDSHEVGNRTVKLQELYIDNNNYNLLTVQFNCEAEITKFNPKISFIPKNFTYDGSRKKMSPNITGLPGDEVSYIVKYKGVGSTNYRESEKAPVMAGAYEATVTTNDPNYVDRNYSVSMTINKATINIIFGGDKMQTYGSVTGLGARAKGINEYSRSIPVTYYDSNDNVISDITKAPRGTYSVKAVYSSTMNYLSAEGVEEIEIRPKEVSVSFYSVSDYTYDGTMKHQKASFYDIDGDLKDTSIKYAQIEDGNETNINLDEEGNIIEGIAPKDVGTYVAYAYPPNNNYTLKGELHSTFEISPKPIEIKVGDLVIDEGETPEYNYIVEGIAKGESINSLSQKPCISYYNEKTNAFEQGSPTEVGKYRIKPMGATDKNYTIRYAEGRLTINSVRLKADTSYSEGLLLEGSFSPNTNLDVDIIQNGGYSKAGTSYEVFRMKNEEFKNTNLSDIYEITLDEGTMQDGEITVRLLLNSSLKGEDSYKIAHIKQDGSIEIIESAQVDGEYLEFSVNELGNFSVIVDSDDSAESQIWIYVTIAGAVLFIIIGIVIIKKKA